LMRPLLLRQLLSSHAGNCLHISNSYPQLFCEHFVLGLNIPESKIHSLST
jgi:hypothetical protein